MGKPVIGLNCNYIEGETLFYRLDTRYAEAIEAAKGIPLLLPNAASPNECDALLDRIDGLILTGGKDIDPKRWHERKHPKAELLPPEKEKSDFLLAKRAVERDIPILGICYGHQLINVVRGGSLHQHVPDIFGKKIVHTNGNGTARHRVGIERGTLLRKLAGATVGVPSSHHQAINGVGDGLKITAYADDGVIEAWEMPDRRFVVGVQWHPERAYNERPHMALFKALVASCMRT